MFLPHWHLHCHWHYHWHCHLLLPPSLVLLSARIGAPLSCVPEPLRPALVATRCRACVASSS